MQIFVHSLQGNTLALNVNASSSVAAVKSMIQEREGKKE
jgi:small subunit ribosomal protein S27Ae